MTDATNDRVETTSEAPQRTVSRIDRWDVSIAAAVALAIFLLLLPDLTGPGITWDEGAPNIPDAKRQAAWFTRLFSMDAPFSEETIDRYFKSDSDHPSLPKTIAALSHLLLFGAVDEITALRIPSALKFSALIASIFLFLRLWLPGASALAGALSLALMPRVFGHAHIYSLDAPIMCWWFWTAAVGFLVFHGKLKPWWFGVAYGITFTTKLHAVFLPFPLLTWALILLVTHYRTQREYWFRLITATISAVIFTPVIYIGLQPWLWHDTWPRIYERFFDYASKSPIPLYYLGMVYTRATPWHYPLVMILFTVPLFILGLLVFGLLSPTVPSNEKQTTNERGIYLFLLLHFLTPLLIVLLPLAKAYDGCRLFLPCFPFAACLVGFGYHTAWSVLRQKLPGIAVHAFLWLLLVIPSAVTYAKIRPFYLAYYNELTGGIDGAWKRGMETVYWCDALNRDFLKTVNQIVPEGKTVKPASMSFAVIDYYSQRGWFRPQVSDPADYFLLQCRQGMFSRDEQFLYYHQKPVASVELDGVLLFALYKNPKSPE